MKKQWKRFLQSKPMWPYQIVPNYVTRLDEAIKKDDMKEINILLKNLSEQGIILDEKGNLVYLVEEVFKNLDI